MDNSLRELLKDWVDFETTLYYIGISLGLFELEYEKTKITKIINYIIINDIKYKLNKMLIDFIESNMINHDNEYDSYCWNPNYKLAIF